MARTYGQSDSMGTQTGQPTSALPSYRSRMLKALRSRGNTRRNIYAAKPSAYPIGPPPVRPPALDVMTPPFNPNAAPILIDEPTMDEAYIAEPNFDFPVRDIPAITPPGYDSSARVSMDPAGVSTPLPPQTTIVNIGGRAIEVPVSYVADPPPALRNPGAPPLIDERGVQQSRNSGGQLGGAFAALAALMGGDPGFIAENLPGIMANGIAGGERGAIDRYGREVNNYQQSAASIAAENANAQQGFQNSRVYAGDLNQAAKAPTQAAIEQIETENTINRLKIQQANSELAGKKFDYTRGRDARKDFSSFAKRFESLTPEAREALLSNPELLRAEGIDEEFEVEALRKAQGVDFRDATYLTKNAQININKKYDLIKDRSISQESRERAFQDIGRIAAKYDIDLGGTADKIDVLDMPPADKQRLHIQMLNYLSISGYRRQYLAYLNSLVGERAKDRELKAHGLYAQIVRDAQGDEDKIGKSLADLGLAGAMFEDNPQLAKKIFDIAMQKARNALAGTPEAAQAQAELRWLLRKYPQFAPPAITPPGGTPPPAGKGVVAPPGVPQSGTQTGSTRRNAQLGAKNVASPKNPPSPKKKTAPAKAKTPTETRAEKALDRVTGGR